LPWDVAPEKADDLSRLGRELNTAFDVMILEGINPVRFAASTNTLRTHIKVGRGTLDTYWVTVFAYGGYLRSHSSTDELAVRLQRVDTGNPHEFARALAWADDQNCKIRDGILARNAHRTAPWPGDVPAPGSVPFADELYLQALGFTLHHEISHIRKDHRHLDRLPPDEIAAKEDEADELAADWILGGLGDARSGEFVNRADGIALGLHLLIHLRMLSRGVPLPKWHNPTCARVRRVLSRHLADDDHPTWRFAFSLHQITLSHFNVPCEWGREFASYRAGVEYCLEAESAYSPG
jgi:hypothetical protein